MSLPNLEQNCRQTWGKRGKLAQFNEETMPSGDEPVETSEEDSLQRLRMIRGRNRSNATKLMNKAYEFMQQCPNSDELDPEIRNKLEIKAQ